MKIELTVRQEFDVKYLLAEVGARYWEDATVNGIEDTEGDLIPCRDGDLWVPLIELETGKILNWQVGKTAKVHYKSCDCNVFKLLDADNNVVSELDGYVINMMCPGDDGYGDYVIMDIDADGVIADFKPDFREFESDGD